jgi:hypothetical protein
MQSGNLNFPEPSGPLQACNGTALPLRLILHISCAMSNVQTRLSTNYYTLYNIRKSLQHVAANTCCHLKMVKFMYFVKPDGCTGLHQLHLCVSVKPDGCTGLHHLHLCVSVHINTSCIVQHYETDIPKRLAVQQRAIYDQFHLPSRSTV